MLARFRCNAHSAVLTTVTNLAKLPQVLNASFVPLASKRLLTLLIRFTTVEKSIENKSQLSDKLTPKEVV